MDHPRMGHGALIANPFCSLFLAFRGPHMRARMRGRVCRRCVHQGEACQADVGHRARREKGRACSLAFATAKAPLAPLANSCPSRCRWPNDLQHRECIYNTEVLSLGRGIRCCRSRATSAGCMNRRAKLACGGITPCVDTCIHSTFDFTHVSPGIHASTTRSRVCFHPFHPRHPCSQTGDSRPHEHCICNL